MLEDFARHGLVDIATDYGIFLLAFSKRGLAEHEIGASPARNRWAPTPSGRSPGSRPPADGGMLEFLGNQASHRALQGRLLVRKSDGLPLRIQSWSEHPQEGHMIRDEGTVDYRQSPHGFLTPASVVHRHLVDGNLITENLYRYEPFKLFSADAEIKFTELDTPPPPAAPSRNDSHPLPSRLRILPRLQQSPLLRRAFAGSRAPRSKSPTSPPAISSTSPLPASLR